MLRFIITNHPVAPSCIMYIFLLITFQIPRGQEYERGCFVCSDTKAEPEEALLNLCV